MGTKITDLSTDEETALVDEIAQAMAEVDGIWYWKFDPGDGRTHYEQMYRTLARKHLAAQRIIFRHALLK